MRCSRDTALLLTAGLSAGAGLAILLDPARGRRRRALIRNKAAHLAHLSRKAMTKVGHDARNRARGATATARHLFESEQVPDDNVLLARIRSRLGHVVSHPHALQVEANGGKVTLSGPILAREAGQLLSVAGAVAGVRELEDRLELHDSADIPALQGGHPREERYEWMQARWSPFTRFLSIAWGAGMLAYGVARHDRIGIATGAWGACCLARGIANRELREMIPHRHQAELDLNDESFSQIEVW